MSQRPVVWIHDAHYQIFRAYHSMPDLRAPDGRPVGAFRGYAASLLKWLSEHRPTHAAAAWDHAMISFRNDLYAEYKAGRTEAPEDLEPQFELCRRFTEALGLPVFSLEKYEADDVIATMVYKLLPMDVDVCIASADKDLGALVSERVALWDPRKEVMAGPAEIEQRLGVPPELVGDFLTLVGDAVDNIPGVRGIGAKTAATLLNAFGGIAAIPGDPEALAATGLRGAKRVARALAEGAGEIRLSRELVRMREDLPIDVTPKRLEWSGAARRSLEPLLAELGAESLLARVPLFRD